MLALRLKHKLWCVVVCRTHVVVESQSWVPAFPTKRCWLVSGRLVFALLVSHPPRRASDRHSSATPALRQNLLLYSARNSYKLDRNLNRHRSPQCLALISFPRTSSNSSRRGPHFLTLVLSTVT